MSTWQALRRGTTVALAGAAVVVGVSVVAVPASAQETIACVSNRLGLVRIVEDESQCKFWEHAQTIGGGDGSDGSGVKFVFVTSTTYEGDIAAPQCTGDCSTGIARARFECNRLAGDVGLPGAYEPWLSDSTSNAVDRMPDPGGPWFNVKGDLVAATLQGLINTASVDLYNPIRYTEAGGDTLGASPYTWTGTYANGANTAIACDDWSDFGTDTGTQGSSTNTDETWTVYDLSHTMCSNLLRIYCFQNWLDGRGVAGRRGPYRIVGTAWCNTMAASRLLGGASPPPVAQPTQRRT
jgi:hypothetical protein